MSHWKKFESNVLENTKRSLLKAALVDMGVELDESIKSIRNTWGNETVDAGLKRAGKALALGLNFKTVDGVEKLELSGDFYGTGLSEHDFIDKLAQVYQKHNIIEKCEQQGWTIDSVSLDDKGEIVIDAYTFA
jgi:hypothetical protein